MSDPPTASGSSGELPPTEGRLSTQEEPAGDSRGLSDIGTTGDPNLTTADAPSFHAPPGARQAGKLRPGERCNDFEIVSVLGAGAFATVYLARQLSLDRQVALKVSANRGREARTLASLEHEHIVRVFSEVVDPQRDQRLLCMQYVNGTTLARVIDALAKRDRQTWSGRAILEAIDELSTSPATFDPAALRDRELLWNADFVEAACWIGARLAEALAHAHSQGVLHRDIKPANILLNRYGRPMLADFNIAFDPRPEEGSTRALFGGTLEYMAPEHIDAFNPAERAPREAVDQRSDIYSLGVVLFELLTGQLPFPQLPREGSTTEALRRLAADRRAGPPAPAALPAIPELLARVVRRCLQPRPEDRYPSAHELARVLESCRDHRRMEKALPAGALLTRTLVKHPFAVGAVLLLLPHVVGSIVNIWYNGVRIVNLLTPAQQVAFYRLVMVYNLTVYPVCLVLMVCVVVPIVRFWRRLDAGELLGRGEVNAMRRRVLQLPLWAVGLSCAGWLPGGVLFPLGLYLFAGLRDETVFGHFLLSFTISGLIALTYSVFAVQYVVLRALYPRLWVDASDLLRQAAKELRPVARRLRVLQLLAGLIPLTGAILMIAVGPEDIRSSYLGFRLLVTLLIASGMLGFGVAVSVSGLLEQTVAALTGGAPSGAETRPERRG
jgi:serine/threonine protein kinase